MEKNWLQPYNKLLNLNGKIKFFYKMNLCKKVIKIF